LHKGEALRPDLVKLPALGVSEADEEGQGRLSMAVMASLTACIFWSVTVAEIFS